MLQKERILVFTDSRGQHVPVGKKHKVFAESLRDELPNYEIELMLCPMKWTTTIDFLEFIEQINISAYSWIILYCGIVDWSPRPYKSANYDLYNNSVEENTNSKDFNTRDYSQKIVNNKKNTFDKFFGQDLITKYLNKPFDTLFQGEKTINMYSLNMAKKALLPRLKSIPNLIFINSNKVLKDWNGDHNKGRPTNMAITNKYSKLFADSLPISRVVDLLTWNEEEIKKYTCDNIHLSEAGNRYILNKLINIIKKQEVHSSGIHTCPPKILIETDFAKLLPIRPPARLKEADLPELKSIPGKSKPLASLIIGLRLSDDAPERLTHLKFILDWIDFYFKDLFDVLLVEQDSNKKFPSTEIQLQPYVRYKFIFNPDSYNRGWGYNVAVKHFCPNSNVIVFMDVDILPGENFLSEVLACYKDEYDAISPYQNVYDSDADETIEILNSINTVLLCDKSKLKRPVSISGGILIICKDRFLQINGFEQYCGYSCEDRALDVTLLNHISPDRLRIAPFVYAHLNHPTDSVGRKNFDEIYSHLQQNYHCAYEPNLEATDFIHSACSHCSPIQTLAMMKLRAKCFGERDLYKNAKSLTINGIIEMTAPPPLYETFLPPDYCGFDGYKGRELYDAPDPDVDDIRKLYNAFIGERCFIIGNGPSLNKHDLSLLKGEYTFGVNGIFYKTEETGFYPYFYVVEDSSVMKENIEAIKSYDKPKYKFFPTVYKNLHGKNDKTIFFKMNRGFYEKSSLNYAVPRFSTDASDQLFCGQSVTHINLQLAYFLGFTEIYLIGMDFSYVIPKSHKRTGDVLLSDTDDDNHFHPNYFGKGKTWKDPKLDRVEMNYRQAKLVYNSTGRQIYNASVGGKLEVFDRVDYKSLFNNQALNIKYNKIKIVSKSPHHQVNDPLTQNIPDQKAQFAESKFGHSKNWVPELKRRLTYASIAEKIKSKSLTLFSMGQFAIWMLGFLKRHPIASIFSLALLSTLISAPIFIQQLIPYGRYFLVVASLLVLFAISGMGISYGSKKMIEFANREKNLRQALKAEIMRELQKRQKAELYTNNKLKVQSEQNEKFEGHLTTQLQKVDKLSDKVDKLFAQGEKVVQVENQLNERIEKQENKFGERIAWQTQQQLQHYEIVDRKYSNLISSSSVFNFGDYQSFKRKLTKSHVEVLQQEWSKKLSLKFTPKSLAYLAHRICTLENTSRGRLATTIEDAVLRVLVASSVKNKKLRVLEIGTLFGIGLTVIHDHARSRFDSVHLTAIDPLDGYYGKDVRDIITDESIDEQTFRSNLALAGVPEHDYTLIKSMSTEDSSIDFASKPLHDVLIIDGDHSYAGVKADFVNYLASVKRGGYIVFDDYDAPGWPDVKDFVDTSVINHQDVALVGISWRTAVFKVVRKSAATKQHIPSKSSTKVKKTVVQGNSKKS